MANHALAVLTGRAPGNWSPPAFQLGTLALPRRLPVTVPSELVHQRPDILAAEAQLHASSAQIGIATAQLYPSITLSAGVTPTSLNGGNLFSPSGLVWSVAAGLAQPVFDAGMREAERRAALDAFKASAADYKQTVLRAFGQVADILQALAHDEKLLAAQNRALATASEAIRPAAHQLCEWRHRHSQSAGCAAAVSAGRARLYPRQGAALSGHDPAAGGDGRRLVGREGRRARRWQGVGAELNSAAPSGLVRAQYLFGYFTKVRNLLRSFREQGDQQIRLRDDAA